MLPKTTQGRILFLSLGANVLLVAVLVFWFVSYKDCERASRSASWFEASARLHQGLLNLENFKKNQKSPPEDFVRELRAGEAELFLFNVNTLASWVEKLDASNDEGLIGLKKKLQLAREFIAANPELFVFTQIKANSSPLTNASGAP